MISRSRTTSVLLTSVLIAALNGCGAPSQTPEAKQNTIVPRNIIEYNPRVSDHIYFEFDSAIVQDRYESDLRKMAEWLGRYPKVTITVQGYTDERGTREYNLALGIRRASSMRRALVSLGVAEARIKIVSYGKDRPAVVGSNEDAWSQNRRAVAVIDDN